MSPSSTKQPIRSYGRHPIYNNPNRRQLPFPKNTYPSHPKCKRLFHKHITNNQAGVKVAELRTKSKEQLEQQLLELKQELASLKVQKLTRPAVPQIGVVRKDIARVLTVINALQRENVRAFYADKKLIPKDLREKKTRALRRALSKQDAARITPRERKRRAAFPKRVYAIKA